MEIHAHSFDFAITTYCQAKCRSCCRTDNITGNTIDWLTPTHMSYDVFNNILDNSSDINLHRLEFCGELGDPMMHPNIEQFLDRAATQVDYVAINTNGGLRNPEWYTHAAKKYWRGPTPHKLKIVWGIDGMSHDTNWKYREGVDWKRAMDNMTAWFDNNGWGEWHFLIFEWNWHEIPAAYEYAKEHNIDLYFKINRRPHGLITNESRQKVNKLLEKYDGMY